MVELWAMNEKDLMNHKYDCEKELATYEMKLSSLFYEKDKVHEDLD